MEKKKSKEEKAFNVIIETPKGSRNKYAYSQKLKVFELRKLLPAGAVFPFDFGFIPGTKAEDGDPVDVLVVMDEPAFPGCLVRCRIIGALKAKKSKENKMVQNDRLIAVSVQSRFYSGLKQISDLDKNVLEEIEHFFASYSEIEGITFESNGWAGAGEAKKKIKNIKR